MPHFDFICLANSRKHGGRCVAGLRTDGLGWLRPVSPIPEGTLFPPDYRLADDSEVGVLDVVRVGIHGRRATPHQPENWVVDGATWTLLERPMPRVWSYLLLDALQEGPELLTGCTEERVSWDDLEDHPTSASLALIAPSSLALYAQPSFYRRPEKVRGCFSLGTGSAAVSYDLPVTEPYWQVMVRRYGPRTFRQTETKFLAVVSLSEPWEGYCYKLLATIIPLPTMLAAFF